MILPVSNFKASNSKIRKTSYEGTKSYMSNLNTAPRADILNRSNVGFKGNKYPSGYYEDDEIAIAKKFINQSGNECKKILKKEFKKGNFELFGESKGIFHLVDKLGGDSDYWRFWSRVLRFFGLMNY